MTSWWVYIVECADGTYYTGVTPKLDLRLVSHNRGKGAKYTRSRIPVKLVLSERTPSHSDALKREIKIKKMSRAQKKLLIDSFHL